MFCQEQSNKPIAWCSGDGLVESENQYSAARARVCVHVRVEFLNRVHRLHSPHAARWVEPVRRQFVSLCHHHGMQSGRGQSERIMRRIMACGPLRPCDSLCSWPCRQCRLYSLKGPRTNSKYGPLRLNIFIRFNYNMLLRVNLQCMFLILDEKC